MLALRGAAHHTTRPATACPSRHRGSRRAQHCTTMAAKGSDEAAAATQQVLACQQQLLDSIDLGEYSVYKELCSTDITCFEPESKGHLVEGLPFHKFFFDLPSAGGPAAKQSTISSPHVRILGGGTVAVISYVRLQQSHDAATGLRLGAVQETRVWEKQAGGSWKCVHLHRSTEAK